MIEVDRPYKLRIAAVDYAAVGIARYCGVKTWNQRRFGVQGWTRLKVFFGLKSDVEMARYLYQMLANSIKTEAALYTKKELSASFLDSTQRGEATWAFQVGMARRVRDRLLDMARSLEPTAMSASGTALVVL